MIIANIPPVAPPPPVAIVTIHDIPIEQRRPPARSKVFHSHPQIAYTPACSQLTSQTAADGSVFGVVMPDGAFNPLAIVEPKELPRANAALTAMGVCKNKGVTVPITTVQEARLRATVLEVTPTMGESEPAKKLPTAWIRIVVGGGAIALAGTLLILSQRSHNQAASSRESLRQLLESE